MPWPRKSLFLALFFLSSSWGSADTITVNTTTDDNLDNSLCSLREAVEYFNRGMPADGYQGCASPVADDVSILKLPASEAPYLITAGPIRIITDISIAGDGAKGEAVTTVQVQGATRAFIINFDPSYWKPVCAADSSCSPGTAPELALSSDTEDDPADPNPDLTVDDEGDYLTFDPAPILTGTIPATTHTAGHSYVVRLYAHPRESEPFLVGEGRFTPDQATGLSAPLDWSVRVNRFLLPGVHYLTYTVEEIETGSGDVVVEEGTYSDQLIVAVYVKAARPLVALTNLVIKGGGAACASSCAAPVDNNTTVVNDPAAPATYDKYSLTYINVIADTSGNGGVIFNNEELLMSDVVLQDGVASASGGGLYITSNGGAQITNSDFLNNKAGSGAAIYARRSSLKLVQSLIRANLAQGTGSGTIVEVADAATVSGLAGNIFQNSTFTGNTGIALSVRDNSTPTALWLQNLTVVGNTGGGVDFNGTDVEVRNSIIAGNQDPLAAAGSYADCLNSGSAVIEYTLIVAGEGCPATGNGMVQLDESIDEQRLMAVTDPDPNAKGRCNSPYGLLCPLADRGGSTQVLMPRLLPGYDPALGVEQSPLIGKAGPDCVTVDQRGEVRNVYACDMGAVEVQAVESGGVLSGGVISYGNAHEQYLGDELADEELLRGGLSPLGDCLPGYVDPLDPLGRVYPPAQWADTSTPEARARIVPDSYDPGEPGCPWVAVAPIRGTARFVKKDGTEGAGFYVYQPGSNFHGFDRFEMRVVTSLSKLNPLLEDRSRLIRASVIVQPGSTMSSQKLGGALDGWGMLLLGILGLGRLGRRQA